MTTLASPTLDGSSEVSMWQVQMNPGQRGPMHRFDVDQIWHLHEGTSTVVVEGEPFTLSAGDTLVIPREVVRQIRTEDGARFVVCGSGTGLATPITPDGPGEPISPPWIT